MGGDRYLNVPLVQGIYPSFVVGNINIFVIPRSLVQTGDGVNSSCTTHMNIKCVHVHGLPVFQVAI